MRWFLRDFGYRHLVIAYVVEHLVTIFSLLVGLALWAMSHIWQFNISSTRHDMISLSDDKEML